ncbi:transcription-repair coupling factor [Candidatus Poribacteria bacterium]|nr:transcription-repair coupling factor [Candidatus Poribacteria bacterium]MYH82904.1 transcription-repair coupling factor [Candidatus Poribacteria bacterium]MYK94741.1 transcription-repair coupling factor [Candidatus Poribacteria bacterium]
MIELLRETENYQTLVARLKDGKKLPWLRGLANASTAYLLATLIDDFPKKSFLIVLPSQREAEQVIAEICTYRAYPTLETTPTPTPESGMHFFPSWHRKIFDGIAPPKNTVADRMRCLERLLQQERSIVVTTIQAMLYKLPTRQHFADACRVLNLGDEIDPDDVAAMLMCGGYQSVELVEVKGEFARRGDILDVYPLTTDTPVRIEFFGDEIDTIRTFDPISQRSTASIQSVTLTPLREVLADAISVEHWRAQTDSLIQARPTPQLINVVREVTQHLTKATSQYPLQDCPLNDAIEAFLPMLVPETELLTDYLADDTIVCLIEPQWQHREASQMHERTQELYQKKMDESSLMVPPDSLLAAFEVLRTALERYPVISSSLAPPREVTESQLTPLHFEMKPLALPSGNYQTIINQVKTWVVAGKRIHLFCETPQQSKRVTEILAERDLFPPDIDISVGAISEGFLNEQLDLMVISEDELFGNRQHRPIRRRPPTDGTPILSLIDLKVGDYVVHVSHGIARYDGIRRLAIDGKSQDFLILKYSDDNILYVPTYQVDLVQKYIGSKDNTHKPRVDRLGGTAWHRRKGRVKESIEQMADELLNLYALRQARKGYSFPAEVPWQTEFEALFPYQETDDQLQAIEDVKADMEGERPMDRLVCGDVGYGKTEVALRAAFKAVMAEKQVAILVPTTILALQHYDTFEKRFQSFPINIEMLNRFRTPKEIKQIKERLAKGTIDVVIGTHSLLSKTVTFQNLGLLIVDEEHRFGVKHKEKIKQFKETIDVLTLTATPIPRTLHMSLVGIRDFSVINTPPADRLPIQTFVMPYDSEIIREAITTELARDGQVFFVHNRVQDIQNIARTLQELVPDARIAVAHGQMPERELEAVMLEFVRHKHDILVCTMIIESGLDIPNVNTILINRADALGLAQLYQLRGRVGRANLQAYGYLFYPRDRAITEGAEKRLRVIEEFTDLGSGFKIALRDLEIRGTGNILGAEQHGHIVTVGYELYCKLLEEAVMALKGEKVEETLETRINLPVEAYLPDDYVPDSRQKVSIYKKIAGVKDAAALKELRAELQDRYGAIPEPAEMLLEIASVKQLSQNLGITAIVAGKEQVKVTFDEQKPKINVKKFIEIIHQDSNLQLQPPAQLKIRMPGMTGVSLLTELQQTLKLFVDM